jgi:hypothetical protein
MSVNHKAASRPQIKHRVGVNQFRKPKRFARYNLLAELPGLIFGLLTLVYVASALWLLG